HPTAMLASRLQKGDLIISGSGFEKVGLFLERNPDFDILMSNVQVFVEKANLNDIGDKDALKLSLLKLQRIKRLSATWDETAALLGNGLHSALDVVAG